MTDPMTLDEAREVLGQLVSDWVDVGVSRAEYDTPSEARSACEQDLLGALAAIETRELPEACHE